MTDTPFGYWTEDNTEFEVTLGSSSCETCGTNYEMLEVRKEVDGYAWSYLVGCYGGDGGVGTWSDLCNFLAKHQSAFGVGRVRHIKGRIAK